MLTVIAEPWPEPEDGRSRSTAADVGGHHPDLLCGPSYAHREAARCGAGSLARPGPCVSAKSPFAARISPAELTAATPCVPKASAEPWPLTPRSARCRWTVATRPGVGTC